MLTRLPQTMQEQNALTDILREYPERIEWVEAQAVTRLEDIPVTLITGEAGKSVNESGLCVLFQPENYDILITGDRNTPGERALLAQIDLPKLEVLVAGHHGSKSATGLELLTAGAPDAVIISVGENNTYGHPSQEVLERLELFQATVLRTDLHGTITIRG